MDNERIKFPFRMKGETQQMVKALYAQDNCSSQNEFIEKAVKFYISYLTTNKNTSFLNPTLFNALKSALKETENKNASNIFRLSVEMSMMMNLIAAGLEISDEDMKKLRGRCVKEVKKNKGRINMEDAVKYQKGIEE